MKLKLEIILSIALLVFAIILTVINIYNDSFGNAFITIMLALLSIFHLYREVQENNQKKN